MSTAANEDNFSALVAAYLADSSCSPDELEQFLSCRYKLNVHVPMADEELEERLEHMKNIQRLLDNNQVDAGDAEMTRIAASFCLLLPLAKLRGLRDDIKDGLGDLETTFKNLLQTVTLCKMTPFVAALLCTLLQQRLAPFPFPLPSIMPLVQTNIYFLMSKQTGPVSSSKPMMGKKRQRGRSRGV